MTQPDVRPSDDGPTKWDRFNLWLAAFAAAAIVVLGVWALFFKA